MFLCLRQLLRFTELLFMLLLWRAALGVLKVVDSVTDAPASISGQFMQVTINYVGQKLCVISW